MNSHRCNGDNIFKFDIFAYIFALQVPETIINEITTIRIILVDSTDTHLKDKHEITSDKIPIFFIYQLLYRRHT